MKRTGTVYLVGTGPGNSRLLTVRGAELLRQAELVVADPDIQSRFTHLVPESAQVICAVDTAGAAVSVEGIVGLLARGAAKGQCVVRLLWGDVFASRRGVEEAQFLAKADVPFEVIPGVLPATASAAYAGIPMVCASGPTAFAVVEVGASQSLALSDSDWGVFSRMPGPKIVQIAANRVGELVAALIGSGLTKETPVAVIEHGTTSRQRTVAGPLGNIGQEVSSLGMAGSVVLVVGEAVRSRVGLNWCETRPLYGQRVVVTRAKDQARPMVQALQERGAEVLEVPVIRIVAPTRKTPLVEAIAGLNGYDWLIFTSPNGVNSFFEHFFRAFDDLRDIGGVRIAAVGPATAARLKALHLKVDLMPEEYVAAEVAEALRRFQSVENLRFLLLRGEVATPELPRRLEELGGIVDDVACYRTAPETEDSSGAAARLQAHGAEWITFTSGSTVENFHARFNLPELLGRFHHLRLASIGPETTKALSALKLSPAVEGRPHTMAGLIQAMERAKQPTR